MYNCISLPQKHRIIIPEATPLSPHLNQGRYYLSLNIHPDLNTPLDPLYHEDTSNVPAFENKPAKPRMSWYSTYQQVQKRLRHTKYFWKTMDVRIQT